MYFIGEFGWVRAGTIGLAAFFVLGAAGSERSNAVKEPSSESSSKADFELRVHLASFDAAWRIIFETHFDTNFNGVNWLAVRDELRPRAESAKSRDEVRSIIQQMLGRLGQSHMALIPSDIATALESAEPKKRKKSSVAGDPKNAEDAELKEAGGDQAVDDSGRHDGDLGLDVRLVDGRFVVTRVELEGPAAAAGVRAGWVLEAVEDEDLSERLEWLPEGIEAHRRQFLAWRMVQGLLTGRPDSRVRLKFLDGKDAPVEVELTRRVEPGEYVKFGLLPGMYAQFHSQWLEGRVGLRVGLIRFNLWMVPIVGPLDRAIDEFRQADGIVIDLRGNLGGLGGMVMGVSGHFLEGKISLGTMKMRANEIQFFSNPRRVNSKGERVEPYSGPVAVLVDGLSLSTAEVFAGGMQSIGRARVFGEPSGGQALPALWDRLPNGDVLYHAFADFVTPNGVRLEGRGVIPDVHCTVTRSDLLSGRDPVLEAALEWITRARSTKVSAPNWQSQQSEKNN